MTETSALMAALYNREFDEAERLVDALDHLTLFEASAVGDVDRVRTLLDEQPESVEDIAPDGFTALHLAAFFGWEPVAALLIERNADANAVAANPSRVRPLHSAVAARSVRVAEILLAAGADPNAQQIGGWTALMAAAKHGHVPLVEALLAANADASITADDGSTAIDLADDSVRELLS